MEDQDEQEVFAMMARIYPHEIAAAYPEQFREFFCREYPGVSEAEMLRLLEASL